MRLIACLLLLVATGIHADVSIISRTDWGALAPTGALSRYEDYGQAVPDYDTIVLHVTAMGHGSGAAEARRIQAYQMTVRGFADIAYNFLIDSQGKVYEGRPLTVVPAHAGRAVEADESRDITLDPDFGAIGITFTAGTHTPLSVRQVESAIALIQHLQAKHPVTRVITHTEVGDLLTAMKLTPVHDHDPESCPGRGTVDDIIRIRTTVDEGFDPAAYRARFNR